MESIDSPQNPTPRLKVVPPNQIKPPTSSPATQKLPIPAQLPTQPTTPLETTLPTSHGGGSGGSGGSSKIQNAFNKIPHSLIMVGSIAAVLTVIGLTPLDHSIKTGGNAEPNPEKVRKIPAHQGTIVKEIVNSREVKEGELIISTVDPIQEEKLRKTEQEILEAQSQKTLAEKEELTRKQELEQAMFVYRSAVNIFEQSRMNLATAPIALVHEAEIQEKRQQQESLRNQLIPKKALWQSYENLIKEGGAVLGETQIAALQTDVIDLEGRISSLEAQIIGITARKSLAMQQLLNQAQEASDRALEKEAALATAERELGLVRQKVQELNRKIKQLEQERSYQKDQQKRQRILAPFDGVAELEEIKNHIDQKLSQSVYIPYYSPDDMMVKLQVLQIDYCQVQKGKKVSFIPNGGQEYRGEIYQVIEGVQADTINPDQRLATAWVKLENPNRELTKGMNGRASIEVGREQIYKIVWREIYKIIGFAQSVPNVRSCK